jgi:hypothetical protein
VNPQLEATDLAADSILQHKAAGEQIMSVIGFRRAVGVVVVASAGILGLSGCSSAPAPAVRWDYSQSLDRYYEGRPACLWPDAVEFPVKDATPDQIDEHGFAALVASGLLVEQRPSKNAATGAHTFDLSLEGRSAIDRDIFNKSAGNFCYGRRKVTSIDAQRRNSSSTELVDYHYSLVQPAAWATEHAIQSAFPQVAEELAGPHKAEVTMLDTTDGWEVSGTPATIAPVNPATHTSTLARATALLLPRRKPGT